MEGKSRIAVSEIVKVLTESGAVKSRTTAYDWIEKETVGFGRVVEEGQKYWEGDFSKLFNWLRNKLGEKEIVREIVEQGVPFKEYKALLTEIRNLEKEVAKREAALEVERAAKRHLEEEIKALKGQLEELKARLAERDKELSSRLKVIRELELKLRLKELEPLLADLPAEKKKKILEAIGG